MLPGRLKIRNLSVFSRILSEKLKNRIPLAWKTIYRVKYLSNLKNIWVFEADLFDYFQLFLKSPLSTAQLKIILRNMLVSKNTVSGILRTSRCSEYIGKRSGTL